MDPTHDQKSSALCRQISGLFRDLTAAYAPEHGSADERQLAERVSLWLVSHPERLKLMIEELKRQPGADTLKKMRYALAELVPAVPAFAPPPATEKTPAPKPAKPQGKKGRKAASTDL